MNKFVVILLVFFLTIPGCALNKPLPPNIKKIGIISSFGSTLTYGVIGLPTAFNHTQDVNISDWKIDEFTAGLFKERLSKDGYIPVVVAVPPSSFVCQSGLSGGVPDQLHSAVQQSYPDVDIWIVLSEARVDGPCPLRQAMTATRSRIPLVASDPHRFTGVSVGIDVVDGHTFEPISYAVLGALVPRRHTSDFNGFAHFMVADYPDRWEDVDSDHRMQMAEHFKEMISNCVDSNIAGLGL